MKFLIPALIMSPLITGISFAQSEPDCRGREAWMMEACKDAPLTSKRRFVLEKPTPEYERDDNAFAWGTTFDKNQTEDEKEAQREKLWQMGAVWNASDKASIEKVLVYSPTGTNKPIMRIIYKDMSEKERALSYAERELWKNAKKDNADLQLLNLTYTLTDPPERPEDPYSEFRRLPVDFTASKEKPSSPSRSILEESLDIPEEHRGKDGPQCTETRDPDGTYRRHCSQTWSYSASN